MTPLLSPRRVERFPERLQTIRLEGFVREKEDLGRGLLRLNVDSNPVMFTGGLHMNFEVRRGIARFPTVFAYDLTF